ncbi:MAG: CsbD family protein [Chloroflexi bacterium]|nr:MAG: CsbD family protein [Chloroflexota bacterium]
MNWDEISGNWKQLQGKAREKWGDLTDDDMTKIGGKKDQLVGTLQEKYGHTKEAAGQAADDWAESLKNEADEQKRQAS